MQQICEHFCRHVNPCQLCQSARNLGLTSPGGFAPPPLCAFPRVPVFRWTGVGRGFSSNCASARRVGVSQRLCRPRRWCVYRAQSERTSLLFLTTPPVSKREPKRRLHCGEGFGAHLGHRRYGRLANTSVMRADALPVDFTVHALCRDRAFLGAEKEQGDQEPT